MITDNARPSVLIYKRRDVGQLWRECDSPYELGYVSGAADRAAGETQLEIGKLANMTRFDGDYIDGYRDGYCDANW